MFLVLECSANFDTAVAAAYGFVHITGLIMPVVISSLGFIHTALSRVSRKNWIVRQIEKRLS